MRPTLQLYYSLKDNATLLKLFKKLQFLHSFINLRKNICQKYYFDQELKRASENILLRYNRDTGYKVFCSTKVDIDKNDYLKELGCSLDTFLLNRNIQMIQFITTVPY